MSHASIVDIAKLRFKGVLLAALNRLLDGGTRGFEEGISAAQYKAVAQVSKATATRHLSDLLSKGCIVRLPGGGRSTRYVIAPVNTVLPSQPDS